ncbi:HNH endonuclease signature motif containing protein [Actinomycetospora sp. C-140]
MSEGGVGPVEREALDRARQRLVASRQEYYRGLEDIAELDRLAVVAQTGDKALHRLLGDLGLFDTGEARRLCDEAADLVAGRSLAGEPLAPRYPCTAAVLAAGRTGPAHIAIIRATMTRLERVATIAPGDLAECERILAEAAAGLPPRMLRRVAERLLAEFDPDGVAPPDGADVRDELRLLRRRDGSLALKGRLQDPLDAEMIVEVFDLLSTPAGPDDDRDLARRHADALKDLAQNALGATGLATDARRENSDHTSDEPADARIGTDAENADDAVSAAGAVDDETISETSSETDGDAADTAAGGGGDGTAACGGAGGDGEGVGQQALIPEPRIPEPLRAAPSPASSPGAGPARALLTITIDHRWLCDAVGHGVLDSGHAVDVTTIRRWACDAGIVPMVLGSRGEPLDVGRLSYSAPEGIRRALIVRDGGCAFPGCTRRPRRCHAHHVRQWLDHGDTALDNMTLLCRFHHQLIHHGHWTVAIVDGLPWFTPPAWIDPDRQPRLGGRARVSIERSTPAGAVREPRRR